MQSKTDLVTFSHLRWNFVYQRPQHIISRFTKLYRVFYIEEPVFNKKPDGYEVTLSPSGVRIMTPHLHDEDHSCMHGRLQRVIDAIFGTYNIQSFYAWYYTPMALEYTRHLQPEMTIYDCMDELAAFKDAPAAMLTLENELLEKAAIVFTGGQSLYNAKKHRHSNMHCFPSSIDKEHFFRARNMWYDLPDQTAIPFPRFGFFGVIDERLDIDLIETLAVRKPEWQFIFIGPVVKIDPERLPRHQNIHYLGMKRYEDLPGYISTWDVAILPFALNMHTQFISPTKTPEYLAAGKPVIATAITDVVTPYGDMGLVDIADTVDDFIKYGELELVTYDARRVERTDDFLETLSWDHTWAGMNLCIADTINDTQLQKV